jgi:hypothetical protein
MEILNQLEKRDFQVMKFLLKSVSTLPNDQKQNTWKTDQKYIYEILYQKFKEKIATSPRIRRNRGVIRKRSLRIL